MTTAAAFDGEGAPRWQQALPAAGRAEPAALAALDDGGFVVVGSTLSAASGRQCARVLRLEGDGTLRWQRAYAAQPEPAAQR